MKTLKTVRLKPNPTGKDKSRTGYASPAQLGAEWVDIKNVGLKSVPMAGVKLYHIAYPADRTKKPYWEAVISFTAGGLEAGNVWRVHSGEARELSVLREEDRRGADRHLFTGRDSFIWNNAEGDTSRLVELANGSEEVETERASYDSNPPEGIILIRSGAKLVPPS